MGFFFFLNLKEQWYISGIKWFKLKFLLLPLEGYDSIAFPNVFNWWISFINYNFRITLQFFTLLLCYYLCTPECLFSSLERHCVILILAKFLSRIASILQEPFPFHLALHFLSFWCVNISKIHLSSYHDPAQKCYFLLPTE